MRVAPIGYLYQHDLPKLRQVAAASALATHHHPAAQLGAVAAAFLVKLALDRISPEDMLPALELENHSQAQDFDQTLVPGRGPGDDLNVSWNHIGEGWVAEEAVLMAFIVF
jgi:ADP-ribosylglycohydrolase